MKDLITYRHPRTLQQAFGPYTSSKINEGRTPYRMVDKVVIFLCILVWLFVPLAILLDWI